MELQQHAAAISAAAGVLAEEAARAGLDTGVPTCPGWQVADLVAHQGMVHRWATARLAGDPADPPPHERYRDTVRDLPGWLVAGAEALVDRIRATAPGEGTGVFLADAPPPREFWARRQAHETTVHAVDALAARLGRVPYADEAGIGTALALDGLDELLTGFLPRGRPRVPARDGRVLLVRPEGAGTGWRVRLAEHPVTEWVRPPTGPADVVFSGTAQRLYLGLWNRGDEVATDDPALWQQWRAVRIGWG